MTLRLLLVCLVLSVAACDCDPKNQSIIPSSALNPTMNTTQLTGEPKLPGIEHPNDALVAHLAEALQAKGPGYKPRTEHFQEGSTADGHADGREPRFTNRLILETSPYLLQHAHNPVNWAPWGEEAFARAKQSKKPVLLSVGYSTCHWCHVMERESFENIEIATFINRHFIPIKVDREERPDVDEVYMRAVYLLNGHGGWPMTVVLTPDKRPFFAGTYFPPFDGARGARRGFLSILRVLDEAYRDEPEKIAEQATQLSQRLAQLSAPEPPGDIPSLDAIDRVAERLEANFDRQHGGFGSAPKFPQPAQLTLLLRHHSRRKDSASLRMVETTLHHMAIGGIHDQVGGGFHRYSVDREWLVPHFEKMLYDNAQLAAVYLEAYQATGREDFAKVARRILDYVAREMTSPAGGFYSATDADSETPSGEQEEGWFFTWTPLELGEVLGDATAAQVAAYYGVSEQGNFEGRSILHTPRPLAEVASELGLKASALEQVVVGADETLYRKRGERPAPLRDDKILAGWNGLMISAFARGALVLGGSRYREIAVRASRFVLKELRQGPAPNSEPAAQSTNSESASPVAAAPRLLRSHLEGRARHLAVLEDYAFLIAGLLDVYEATADPMFLDQALELQAIQDADFAAPGGGYFMTAHHAEELLARDKPDHDGALPSGNSVSADNLLRLAAFTDDDGFRKSAERLLAAFSRALISGAAPAMLAALDRYLGKSLEIVIIRGEGEAALLEAFRDTHVPRRIALVLSESEAAAQSARVPVLEGKVAIEGRATAYVCERGRCELPTDNPDTFRGQLEVVPSPSKS